MSSEGQKRERGAPLETVMESSAVKALGLATIPASTVGKAVPVFERGVYKAFKAEYGVKDQDIVIHFYLPLENPERLGKVPPKTLQSWNAFWLETFPEVLSPTAQEYFQEDKPRILAKYTPEVASWWFVARGFGSRVLDPVVFSERFLERLDALLLPRVEHLPPLDGT